MDIKMENKTARQCVLDLLQKMRKSAYSNLVLDHAFLTSGLSEQDQRFAASLFYGVLERQVTLDYVLSRYSSRPLDKLDGAVLSILRMGVYQILYMNSVPDSAAVHESVELARYARLASSSSYINAILRGFLRDNAEIQLPEDPEEAASIEYSCPLWLVKKWKKEYGPENLDRLLKETLRIPPIFVRVNLLRISVSEFVELCSEKGIRCYLEESVPGCVRMEAGMLQRLKEIPEGLYHVQDISSQLCCMALDPQPGETVLDVCAAPGGKSFTVAEWMENRGRVLSFDLHENRVKLIRSGAEKLGLACIQAQAGDAKARNPQIPLGEADRVLCDVPCAGLGVIRRKPEIKYKSPEDLEGLPKAQYDILSNAAQYLRPGGILVYSTCSLSRDENENVVRRFLRQHPNFSGMRFMEDRGAPFGSWNATLFPGTCGGDGFFIAKLRREE